MPFTTQTYNYSSGQNLYTLAQHTSRVRNMHRILKHQMNDVQPLKISSRNAKEIIRILKYDKLSD